MSNNDTATLRRERNRRRLLEIVGEAPPTPFYGYSDEEIANSRHIPLMQDCKQRRARRCPQEPAPPQNQPLTRNQTQGTST